MPFPKEIRVSDPDYLAHCRRQPCSFEGPHRGLIEAHHVGGKGMGGARLRDDLAVPACGACHRRCHGTTVSLQGRRLGPIDRDAQLAAAHAARERFLAARAA